MAAKGETTRTPRARRGTPRAAPRARSQEEWRAELARRRVELEERIARVHGDLVHADIPLEQDFAEQAVQREEDEVLAQLEASARAELARIRLALARAERGEYGICAACGEAIEPARLAVVPDTEHCAACAEDR